MRGADGLAVGGEGDRTRDLVAQLAHVAGPVETHERVDRVGIETANPLAAGLRVGCQKAACEQRNVFAALAQGRYWNRKHREPVVEILTEGFGFYRCAEVAVGGG